MRQNVVLLLAILLASACDGPVQRNPAAPSALGPPAATPGSPGRGMPIAPGQTVSGVIALSDPPCGTSLGNDPPEPCQVFAISIPQPGVLKVLVTSAGPGSLAVRVGSIIRWGAAVSQAVTVQAGSKYEIGVALHGGTSSQAFELTTSLEPL